jgi:hypothetical protein
MSNFLKTIHQLVSYHLYSQIPQDIYYLHTLKILTHIWLIVQVPRTLKCHKWNNCIDLDAFSSIFNVICKPLFKQITTKVYPFCTNNNLTTISISQEHTNTWMQIICSLELTRCDQSSKFFEGCIPTPPLEQRTRTQSSTTIIFLVLCIHAIHCTNCFRPCCR